MKASDNRNKLIWRYGCFVVLGILPVLLALNSAHSQQLDHPAVSIKHVASGLVEPVFVTGANDGSGRLFVIEKSGIVRIISNGVVQETPFLDISDRVDISGLERGMLGLALHPDFSVNGIFYVTYVPLSGSWALEQFSTSPDPDQADPGSAQQLIFLSRERHFGGHYAGMLEFGPDGYLYITIGDGGGVFDPYSNAQDLSMLSGSMLRIDVDGSGSYSIPPDNPYVGVEGARPEIWHYGLRNPWRFSFDRHTGELFIGDVGYISREEINYTPASSGGGLNFGWPVLEGSQCSEIFPDCDPAQFEPPIFEYSHADGCTVVGGYSYRRHEASPMYGRYIFGDYCDGTIWSLARDDNDGWVREQLLDTELRISSFGTDESGRIYVADISGGQIFELYEPGYETTPIISHLSQATIAVGDGLPCVLSIYGENFREDAVVNWNDTPLPAKWVSSQQLDIDIQPAAIGGTGPVAIYVQNPDADSSESNAVELQLSRSPELTQPLAGMWQRTDLPVQSGVANRSWIWGPVALSCPEFEPYQDSPGGFRIVQYFEKARLEITDPEGAANSIWHVTGGLLATELISGRIQSGDTLFEDHLPARINIAGDPEAANGPTYAMFRDRLEDQALPVGEVVTQKIDSDGLVTVDPQLSDKQVSIAAIDDVTGHAIPEPFLNAINISGPVWENGLLVEERLFESSLIVTGRPVTEPYWSIVQVNGIDKNVLIQCFERRCLTYTPDNPAEWQVEASNSGSHYLQWKHEQ